MYIRFTWVMIACFVVLTGCNQTVPKVELPQSHPEIKTTNYSNALHDLGLMTEIYDSISMKIMSNQINDVTGASRSTGSEIPSDITEMTKSALNSIGGKVRYIPYDPLFIQYSKNTGYSNFENKVIPNVVISGGITEFDRGLETRGTGTDVGGDATIDGEGLSAEYGDQSKSGLARITLDFNMLDFKTMTGIPRMNAVNSMEVHKTQGERAMSVSLFGVTFGSKGEIKKVQGRHEAVRLLVEMSMIQMVGRYAILPYWKLLGGNAQIDREVIRFIERYYYKLSPEKRLKIVQDNLYVMGHSIDFAQKGWSKKLHQTLKSFDPQHNEEKNDVSLKTYIKLYVSLPITYEALARKKSITQQRKKSLAAATPFKVSVKSDKASYSVGDEIFITAQSSKKAHLRCYYQDAKGSIVQIFPNPFQKNNYVSSFTTVRIPDSTAYEKFGIELSTSSVTEHFVCFGSDKQFKGSLPEWALGKGLEKLPVSNMNSLIKLFNSIKKQAIAGELLSIPVN